MKDQPIEANQDLSLEVLDKVVLLSPKEIQSHPSLTLPSVETVQEQIPKIRTLNNKMVSFKTVPRGRGRPKIGRNTTVRKKSQKMPQHFQVPVGQEAHLTDNFKEPGGGDYSAPTKGDLVKQKVGR